RHARVAVDVRDRVLRELLVELLAPLGRADEAVLLGVPAREHDRALRLEARAFQLAERARALEERRRAGAGIDGAVHPRVAVIADDHPLVGALAGPLGD